MEDDYEYDLDLDRDDLDVELDFMSDEEAPKTHFKNRRRELEEKIEMWTLRDELGIYNEDLFA